MIAATYAIPDVIVFVIASLLMLVGAVFVVVTPPSDDLDDVAVDVRDLVVGSDRPLDGLNDLDGGSAADEARHVTLQIPEILFLVRATRIVQTKKVLNLKIGPDS